MQVELLPLIKKIAFYYHEKSGLELEDLIQEGYLGVLEAEKKFDKNKNNKFSTYAVFWIKKKILDYIKKELVYTEAKSQENFLYEEKIYKEDKIIFPENMPQIEKQIISFSFNDELSLLEIAEKLSLPREKVRRLKEKALRRLKKGEKKNV